MPDVEKDVYKTDPGELGEGVILRGAHAGTRLCSGLAQAAAHGFEAMSKSLNEDNITRFGVDNGWIEGVLKGTTRFLAGAAQATEDVYDELQATRLRRRTDIDYERLAQMVAEEMKKGAD